MFIDSSFGPLRSHWKTLYDKIVHVYREQFLHVTAFSRVFPKTNFTFQLHFNRLGLSVKGILLSDSGWILLLTGSFKFEE